MRVKKSLLISILLIAISIMTLLPKIAEAAKDSKDLPKEPASYSEVTKDPKFIQALNLLDGTTGEWAKKSILGNNISEKPIKISFRNLSKISPEYKDFDALGWKQGSQLFIFINEKHKNAPVEALASILCHESIHQDDKSSIEEETYGWGYEADMWIQMKKKNPTLNNSNLNEYPLVNRLNTLESMFKDANYTSKAIRQSVLTNPGYKDLPLYSPGFEETEY